VAKQGSALVPSSLGRVVSAFLEAYFRTYVDYAFTSGLEQQLDEVSAGRAQWKEVLAGFWGPFQGVVQGMAGISVTQVRSQRLHRCWCASFSRHALCCS
jgi:DNA topoisomerase-1